MKPLILKDGREVCNPLPANKSRANQSNPLKWVRAPLSQGFTDAVHCSRLSTLARRLLAGLRTEVILILQKSDQLFHLLPSGSAGEDVTRLGNPLFIRAHVSNHALHRTAYD